MARILAADGEEMMSTVAMKAVKPDAEVSPRSVTKPALVASDIHKSYGSHEVLSGVSLTAAPGDVISIIGSSGSGKSTFLRCMNFLEQPDAGQIIVRGEPIHMHNGKDGRLRVSERYRICEERR